MAEKALTDTETNDGDLLCAPKLLGIIMLNCRGRVDHCIPHFVGLALSRRASFPHVLSAPCIFAKIACI